MSTTLGEVVIDLFVDDCPLSAKNFLKLCKVKYYNNVLFFNVQENFMVQSGDPTGTGQGGTSIYGMLYGPQAKHFEDEIRPHLKHNRKGLVAMANTGPNSNASQFYITMRGDDLEYLDKKHTIFGEVAEGMDVLDQLNSVYVDDAGRPYQDVRIMHTHILEDPFPDPDLLVVPPASPVRGRPEEETVEVRLAADEKLDENEGRTEEEIEKSVREKEAKSRAVVLEMIGDLPDADVKPPEEVLFVAKLNPVTESSDLDMAFCRFGPCKSEVIRDYKTGDSLCYAFVEFTDKRHCEEAYIKMNNVLLDDRRIKVDFSQSVSKLWNKFKRRPWEKHSKADGDPQKNETRRDRRDVGGNLRLKNQQRGGGERFDLVAETNDSTRKHRAERDRPRDRNGSSRRRSRSGSRGRRDPDRPLKHTDRESSRDHGRDRRGRSPERSSKSSRGRSRSRSRSRSHRRDDRDRTSHRDSKSSSRRHRSSSPSPRRSRHKSRSRERDSHRRR
ncbi:TPA: hypothetical protein N0F65_010025 [Lagenidium giganteum]|uniref:Peptidyl-prolyl cis-trans isomerase n=1 Tax=Lagenidium giganteum TaxID=4803 RepID=A0AAV2ZHU5_9STRA|nr:TPA: hypothetical protein N0F65_010025 [Lagenidium giganteum]